MQSPGKPITLSFDTKNGHFGPYGGKYAPESQIGFLEDLTTAFQDALLDPSFWDDFCNLLTQRPSPLHLASTLTALGGGAKVWLKREDLSDYGSANQYGITGQILLARRMGKTEIITDCGSAKHGIESAAMCKRSGMKCTVFIGAHDAEMQQGYVDEILSLGAECKVIESGCRTLRAASAEALRTATLKYETAFYIPNSSVAPHPYPWIVRTFESVIGKEVMVQLAEENGSLPQALVAPIGGNGGAIGLFHPFLAFKSIRLVGVQSANSASLVDGSRGVFMGTSTVVLQDDDGQVLETESVGPDMDHPGVGPEIAHWYDNGRLECAVESDEKAMKRCRMLRELEKVECGLDTGHAVEPALRLAGQLGEGPNLVLLVTGSDSGLRLGEDAEDAEVDGVAGDYSEIESPQIVVPDSLPAL